MTKKINTIYGIAGLILGIICGIASTAFSFGAEQQKIKDAIGIIQTRQNAHEENIDNEIGRYINIITSQIIEINGNITVLKSDVGEVMADVRVLKALVERIERDLKQLPNN